MLRPGTSRTAKATSAALLADGPGRDSRRVHHRPHRQTFFPPPPPPPPPLRGRSVLGLASLIVKVRPPKSVPFKAAVAFSASPAFVISTKAKPRERPVSRSVTMLTFSTAPCASNALRSSPSVVLWGRLPTYRFFIALPLSEIRRAAALQLRPAWRPALQDRGAASAGCAAR